MAGAPEGTAKLEQTQQRGDSRRHRRGMPARTKQELLDGGITEPQVIRDLS